jgi:hypothetical protein
MFNEVCIVVRKFEKIAIAVTVDDIFVFVAIT